MHPYLARRDGQGDGDLSRSTRLEPVLERTLGVPLFQEQMLQDRDGHGGFHRQRSGGIAPRAELSPLAGADGQGLREAARARMERKGVAPDVIDRVDARPCSPSPLYGFPESPRHLLRALAYASAGMKVHRAPEFYCSACSTTSRWDFIRRPRWCRTPGATACASARSACARSRWALHGGARRRHPPRLLQDARSGATS